MTDSSRRWSEPTFASVSSTTDFLTHTALFLLATGARCQCGQKNLTGEIHLNGPKVGTYGQHHWGPWHHGPRLEAPPTDVPWFVFSGIARPADFLSGLEHPLIGHQVLRDHRAPTTNQWRDIVRQAAGHPIVCTAKDWVKLTEEQREMVFWRDRFVHVANASPEWFKGLH